MADANGASIRSDIPQDMRTIARMSGWTPLETRRRLKKLNEDHGGTILTRIGIRYYVSLAELRRHWPDFGKRVVSEDDLDELNKELAEIRRTARQQGVELREMRRKLRQLEARLPEPTALFV